MHSLYHVLWKTVELQVQGGEIWTWLTVDRGLQYLPKRADYENFIHRKNMPTLQIE